MQRGTLISLLVIALLAAGVFMFAGRQVSSWQQQLADGRVVKLEQVEFGSKHSFTYASRWKKWLLKHAPTLANRLNVNPIWGGGSSSGQPSLEFGLTVRDRAGRFQEEPWDHFEIVDEHGCTFGKIAGGGGWQQRRHQRPRIFCGVAGNNRLPASRPVLQVAGLFAPTNCANRVHHPQPGP